MGRSNGTGQASAQSLGERRPRRMALLRDGDSSEPDHVLVEFRGRDAVTADLSAEAGRFAEQHRGRCVAAEWEGPRGWIRFLWCRRH
jgi:hypothetical protein